MVKTALRRASGWRRTALGIAVSLAVTAHANGAQAASESNSRDFPLRFAEAAFDVSILRPLSAVALVTGSAFFVASVPLVAPYGAISGSLDGVRGSFTAFVYAPYEYTVLRGIGDF
jgi:hypothetical protein